MTECHNFLGDSTPGLCRSSSSVALEHDDQKTHSLDLTLGLASSGAPSSPSPGHVTVRPVALYPPLHKLPSDVARMPQAHANYAALSKQNSGNFVASASADASKRQPLVSSTFTGYTDAAMAVKSLFSAAENAFPSRDQIWQTLQKNGAVSSEDSQKTGRLNSLQAQTSEAPPLWSRRAASMQVLMPGKGGVQDVGNSHIMRSCSYGVQSSNLSRQISSIESSSENRPQQDMYSSHGQLLETPEDFQKRKDLQAKRRQEARKRRKLLVDKKSKQNTGLQRLNSRQSVPPDEKFVNESFQTGITSGAKKEEIFGDERAKSCPSTETEGVENASGQHDTSELESSSQKSTIDSVGAASAVPVFHSSPNGTHTSPFKVSGGQGYPFFHMLPEPTPHPVSGAMHANTGFPYVGQQHNLKDCENSAADASLLQYSHPPASFLAPAVGASSTNSLPKMHGSSFTTTLSLPVTVPVNSCVKNGFAIKDCACASHVAEGIGGSCERSAFTPLRRTTMSMQQDGEESWLPAVPLGSQRSGLVPQLSTVSDNIGNKNLSIQRQESIPLPGRLSSQSSCVKNPSITSSTKEEGAQPTGGTREGRHATSADVYTPRSAKADIKMEEGSKQSEVSSKSRLASELSGVEAATYGQSGVLEKQRSMGFPDVIWVTTTGKGPNGKTIYGVMYLTNGRHVRLVCTCHGVHMSPAEFVEHSGSTDLSHPERSIVVSPFPFLNRQVPTAPFQS